MPFAIIILSVLYSVLAGGTALSSFYTELTKILMVGGLLFCVRIKDPKNYLFLLSLIMINILFYFYYDTSFQLLLNSTATIFVVFYCFANNIEIKCNENLLKIIYIFFVVFLIINLIMPNVYFSGSLRGIFNKPNNLAEFCFSIVLFLATVSDRLKLNKYSVHLVVLTSIIVISLTASRGSLLAALVVYSALLFRHINYYNKILRVNIILLLSSVLFLVYTNKNKIFIYLFQKLDRRDDDLFGGRVETWIELIGKLSYGVQDFDMSPHSLFFQILINTGLLIGFVLLIIIFYKIIVLIKISIENKITLYYIPIILSFVLISIVENTLLKPSFFIFIIVFIPHLNSKKLI